MKTSPGLKLRQIGSRYIIVDGGKKQSDATAVHTLNATAADIWKFCYDNPGFTVRDVTIYLIQNYIVDAATAESDARALLEQWIHEGIIIA